MWFDVCFVGQGTYEHYKTTGQVLVTQEKIDKAWEDYCMRIIMCWRIKCTII